MPDAVQPNSRRDGSRETARFLKFPSTIAPIAGASCTLADFPGNMLRTASVLREDIQR
jgi:hypothetical protein